MLGSSLNDLVNAFRNGMAGNDRFGANMLYTYITIPCTYVVLVHVITTMYSNQIIYRGESSAFMKSELLKCWKLLCCSVFSVYVLAIHTYSVIQSDRNCFCGAIVLDSVNKASGRRTFPLIEFKRFFMMRKEVWFIGRQLVLNGHFIFLRSLCFHKKGGQHCKKLQ